MGRLYITTSCTTIHILTFPDECQSRPPADPRGASVFGQLRGGVWRDDVGNGIFGGDNDLFGAE